MSDFVGMAASGWPINLFAQKAVIANGTAVSDIIPTQGKVLVGALMPAAWTAAALGFKTCLSSYPGGFKFVHTNGGVPMTTATLTADTFVAFPSTDAIIVPFLQLASVTANTSTGVNQGAEREVILLFRNYLD